MATVDLGKITASVAVGTVTTGAAGSNASVTNSGTSQDAVLNFQIPQGAKGDTVVLGNEEEYTLYNTTGQNTDGAMTQKAVTDNFAGIGDGNNSVDLDITDENDFVLARFSEGHIKTKEFDSRKAVTSDNIDDYIPVATDDSNKADYSVCDEDGNIIFAVKDGNLLSKYFNSADVPVNVFTKYQGKRLSILGDSISTFGTPDQNNSTGLWTYPNNRCRYPQNNLLTDVTKCYWYRLMEACGMELGINESWAGSRVSNTQQTDSGDLGPNRCMASTTRIGHLDDKGIPDVILVYGGTNDIGNNVEKGVFDKSNPINYTEETINALPVNTFADAYRTMLIKLMFYYPNAEIVCCLPNFTNTYYNISDLDDYIEIIKEECDFFGIKYIDLRVSGMNVYNRMSYLPDGTHPNNAGMILLFNKIFKQLIFN